MDNNLLNMYKKFYKSGIWTDAMLKTLEDQKILEKESIKDVQRVKKERSAEQPHQLTAEIWDKTTPINGMDASKYMDDMNLDITQDIILLKIGSKVLYVVDVDTAKINHNLPLSMSAEDVAESLKNIYNEERNTDHISSEELRVGTKIYTDAVKNAELKTMTNLLKEILDNLHQLNKQ